LMGDGEEGKLIDGVPGAVRLMRAAEKGHASVVKKCIKAGFDGSAQGVGGWTPLMAAACFGRLDCLRLLLSTGSVDSKNHGGQTALIFAAKNGKDDCVATLLAEGADPDLADNKGVTAAMFAALFGRSEAIRLLMASGVDSKAVDADGHSALMWAARRASKECVELLLESCDPRRKAPDGEDALSLAEKFGKGNFEEVAALIREANLRWDEREALEGASSPGGDRKRSASL
jgi:ankyrin repeat protein